MQLKCALAHSVAVVLLTAAAAARLVGPAGWLLLLLGPLLLLQALVRRLLALLLLLLLLAPLAVLLGQLLALLWLVCSDLVAHHLVATVLVCFLRNTTVVYVTVNLCQLLLLLVVLLRGQMLAHLLLPLLPVVSVPRHIAQLSTLSRCCYKVLCWALLLLSCVFLSWVT
jgi:hypothetical protein